MDEETRRDLRRRKLCFTCQEPWAPGHKCNKGKSHYIEVYSDSDPNEEFEAAADQGDEGGSSSKGAPQPL